MKPRAHWGHYIPKNLWVPMRPQGPNTNTRVPIRSLDRRETHVFSHDLRVQLQSQDLSKNLRVPIPPPGSIHDLRIQRRTSGYQIRPHGLGEPPGPEYDLRIQGEPPGSSTTSGSPDDPWVLTQPPGYEISLQTLRVHTLVRNLQVYSPSPGIPLSNLRNEGDHRLQSSTSIVKQAEGDPTIRTMRSNMKDWIKRKKL